MKKFLSLALMLAFFLALTAQSQAAPPDDLFDLLNRVKAEINLQLQHTDRDLGKTAQEIKNRGLEPKATRQVLLSLLKTDPAFYDCTYLDPQGVIKLAEPEKYRKVEGKDVNDQEQYRRLRETRRPVVSKLFRTVEKTLALVFEQPLVKNEKLLGSVGVVVNSEGYFGRHIRKMGLEKEKRYYWAVLQSDGTLLYDTDDSQIGKNPLTDPRYKKYSDLRRVIKNITQLKSGSDQYTEIEGHTQGTVQAYWDTVEIYGSKFKIVAMKLIGEKKV